MAGGKADYLENKLLDYILSAAAFSSPATVYVALYSVTPSDAGGGTELTGNAYARVAVTNNATNWPAASGGSKSNGTAITFPTATPADWLTAVAFAILDNSVGGNFLYWGPISPTHTVLNTETGQFPAGTLTITED